MPDHMEAETGRVEYPEPEGWPSPASDHAKINWRIREIQEASRHLGVLACHTPLDGWQRRDLEEAKRDVERALRHKGTGRAA